MDEITLEDLEKDFEHYIDLVESGESFIILVDGVQKAVLIPIETYEKIADIQEGTVNGSV